MKKRCLSLLLVCTMIASLFTFSASAINTNQNDIEAERTRMHESVKQQLIAQDALYMMDYFDEVIDSMLSSDTATTYATSQAKSWYAPYGGVIQGVGSGGPVEAQFFNIQSTQQLYDNHKNKATITNFLNSLPDLIDFAQGTLTVGSILTSYKAAAYISSDIQWRYIDIGHEGCCIYDVYDTMEERHIITLMPWAPPYMSVSSSVKIVGACPFTSPPSMT